MEEEKKKGRIDLDWEVLLPRRDDEPPPVLVVATTTNGTEKEPSPLPMGGDQQEQSQREELKRKTDSELEEAINRHRHNVETIGNRLSDGGKKLRANLMRLEDERERRKLCRVEKDNDSCEKLMQSKRPNFTSASDSFRQEAPSSLLPSQSLFTKHFCRKLDEKIDGRTGNAFKKNVPYLGCCDNRKMRLNGQFSPRDRHKSASSSRKSPLQCPTSPSVDVVNHVSSDGDQNVGHCATLSPCHIEEKLSGSFSKKRKASTVQPLNDLSPRNGQTVVLVDEEEPQFIESMEQANKVDECMKDRKIYYPSSDDPESIEICYTDMECLAPEAFLSSTIMNFYIQYVQRLTSLADRERSDYHFFNTYFYEKLKEAVLNKSDRESLFVKFRRWWKGVNIFQRAYLLLPIHENFLRREWKYLNQAEASLDLPIADRIWKNLPRRIEEKIIAVPQQRNDYDCGLFVLFFMERFIDEAPQRLKRRDLAMFGKKWFKPEEASNLRRKIHKLLVEEFHNATEENFGLDHGRND